MDLGYLGVLFGITACFVGLFVVAFAVVGCLSLLGYALVRIIRKKI